MDIPDPLIWGGCGTFYARGHHGCSDTKLGRFVEICERTSLCMIPDPSQAGDVILWILQIVVSIIDTFEDSLSLS